MLLEVFDTMLMRSCDDHVMLLRLTKSATLLLLVLFVRQYWITGNNYHTSD